MRGRSALIFILVAGQAGLSAQTARLDQPKKQAVAHSIPRKSEADLAAERRRAKALDILQRSHALNGQITDRQKGSLLAVQISVAANLDKELTLQWARELFDFGFSLNPEAGGRAQVSAIRSLADANPDEALAMLSRMEPAFLEPSPQDFPADSLFNHKLEMAFRSYAEKKGKPGLIEILSTATVLGDKGRYPYSGVMSATQTFRDPQLSTKVASALVTRFCTRVDSPITAADFAKMLIENERSIPYRLLKPAVDAAAQALQNYPQNDDNKRYYATMNFAKGESITAHGPAEISLLRLAPLLKRVDPELADQIAEKFSILKDPASSKDWKAGGGGTMTMGFDGNKQASQPDQRDVILSEVWKLMWQEPAKAEQLMASIPEASLRAEAYAYAAQQLSSHDPARAARYAEQAQQTSSEVEDSMIKFRSLVAKLQGDAANGRRVEVAQELEPVFRAANQLMRKAVDEKMDTSEIVQLLRDPVKEAAKLEPDLTAANIDTVSFPFERASLLTAAASGLVSAAPARPPNGN